MKLILLQHVKGIGQKGEVVEVKDGFARNNLIPRQLARPATQSAVKQVKVQKEKAVERLQNMKESAQAIHDRINGKSIEVQEKVTDSGKLYAAVSVQEVLALLKKEFQVELPKKSVVMDEHIKELGEFPVKLKLFKGVESTLTLHVKSA